MFYLIKGVLGRKLVCIVLIIENTTWMPQLKTTVSCQIKHGGHDSSAFLSECEIYRVY